MAFYKLNDMSRTVITPGHSTAEHSTAGGPANVLHSTWAVGEEVEFISRKDVVDQNTPLETPPGRTL